MIGQQIGNYEIQSEIGAGGMGMVYRGIDTQTKQPVAIKQLKSELAQPEIIERFKREGEALRELNHPNIVKMIDALEHDGQHYLVMEYVAGGDLTDLLSDGPLPVKKILKLSIDLADALTRAHKLNIVHRDLKPGNVVIAENGTLQLTDFGVAHIGGKQRVTDTHAIVGTADYLPPEVFDNKPFDVRGDIWAFGVMLFEMVTGQRPFGGETIIQVIHAITTEITPDIEDFREDIPPALVDLVYRMLEKDPQARIPSVRIIGAELEAILLGSQLDTSSISTPIEQSIEFGRFAESTPIEISAIKNNLPAQTTPFIGREAELAEVTRLLEDPDIRLTTIIASGGMGKTRLALEVAAQCVEKRTVSFNDGVFLIELAPLNDPHQILPTIAEAIGFQFADGPVPPPVQLAQHLQDKEMLLIMDNFEHIVEGAGIVSEMLKAGANVQVVATSRVKLNLSGETAMFLSGMDFPDWETPEDALQYSAMKLFMQSAKRARPDFELEAKDLDYIARICRLVEGLPLGILLAAAWLESLDPQEIAEELEMSSDVLETELRDVPERQRSIRAVFEYSIRLLPDDLQTLFYRMAVFKGNFDRKAAKAVTDASIRNLNTLVNHSLLQRDTTTGSYTIHELIREYALEGLQNAGLFDDASERHALYYQQLVAKFLEMEESLHEMYSFLTTLTNEWDNIRAAWMWLVDHRRFDELETIVFPVHGYGMQTTRFWVRNELFNYAEAKVGVDIEEADHDFLRYLFIMDIMDFNPESVQRANERLVRSLPIFEQRNDDVVYWIKTVMGFMDVLIMHDYDSALNRMLETLKYYDNRTEYRSIKVPPKGDVLRWIAFGYALKGDFDSCLHYAEQATKLLNAYDLVHALDAGIYVLYLRMVEGDITGDYQSAVEQIEHINAVADAHKDDFRGTYAKLYLVPIKLQEGDVEQAEIITQQLMVFGKMNSNPYILYRATILEAEIALYKREFDKAQAIMDKTQWQMLAVDQFPEGDFTRMLVSLVNEDYQSAKQTFHDFNYGNPQYGKFGSLTAPSRYTDKFGEAAYFGRAFLHILAAIQTGLGEHERAAELLGKISVRPHDNQHWTETLSIFVDLPEKLKAALGDGYNAAFERGKQLDLLDVVPELFN